MSIVGDVFAAWDAEQLPCTARGLPPETCLYRSVVRRVRIYLQTHAKKPRAPADPSRPGERLLACFARMSAEEREALALHDRAEAGDLSHVLELPQEEARARLSRAHALFWTLWNGGER